MCETQDVNLIDLSVEDEKTQHLPQHSGIISAATTNETNPSLHNGMLHSTPLCGFSDLQRRESFENNPFDMVQNLANRPTDPFDLIEQQAQHCMQPVLEVKVGKLLSLSNDDMYDAESTYGSMVENTPPITNSTKYDLVNALVEESPPLSLEQSDSGSASSHDGAPKKAMEHRKRLLKLSISNSTFNSPVSRRTPILMHSGESGFSSEEHSNSPLSSMFQHTAANCSEHMLSAESPLKLVDDDVMSEATPNCQAPCSEFDFAADLEMLEIPILKSLPSPVVEEEPMCLLNTVSCVTPPTEAATLPTLQALREKLRARRMENNNNKEITSLIENLKALICDSNMADKQKQQRVSSLLENLSSTMAGTQPKNLFGESCESPTTTTDNEPNNNMLNVPPQPIKRQGTFDVDLPDSGNAVQVGKPMSPQSDAMISSTATFDGDCAEDKADLLLPEVDPAHSIPQQPDLQEIMEQLSKLLGQQHIGNAQETTIEHAEQPQNSSAGGINPTYIVVMNAPQPLCKNESANLREQSFNEASSTSSTAQAMRRRSQSLCLPDKVKIFQLPLPLLPPTSPQPQSTSAIVPKTPTAQRMMRRNSYSSGTPYTPKSNYSSVSRRSHL